MREKEQDVRPVFQLVHGLGHVFRNTDESTEESFFWSEKQLFNGLIPRAKMFNFWMNLKITLLCILQNYVIFTNHDK